MHSACLDLLVIFINDIVENILQRKFKQNVNEWTNLKCRDKSLRKI